MDDNYANQFDSAFSSFFSAGVGSPAVSPSEVSEVSMDELKQILEETAVEHIILNVQLPRG